MSDGYEIAGRVWPGRPDSSTAVLYLHGIQSHGGWYEWSGSVLAQAGAMVIMPDRRGSGLNKAARGDTPAVQRWLADLSELAAAAGERHAITRWAVVGVSWGGKLAVAWSRDWNARGLNSRVTRVLLVTPGLFPQVDIGLAGRMTVVRSLLTNPARHIEIPLSDPALFTDNPRGQDFIRDDPLKLLTTTARFLYHSRMLDRRLVRLPPDDRVPSVRLLLAENDRIIRNAATERWVRRIAPGAQIEVLQGAAHTLEFEPDVTRYETSLQEWDETSDA